MYAILSIIIPALLNFITVKYQGRPNSPFETHPITTFFSIFALLVYCSLSLVAHLSAFNTVCGARIFRFLTIISFSLSIALPTSLLFPGLSFLLLYLPLLILLSTPYLCGLVQKLIHLYLPEFNESSLEAREEIKETVVGREKDRELVLALTLTLSVLNGDVVAIATDSLVTVAQSCCDLRATSIKEFAVAEALAEVHCGPRERDGKRAAQAKGMVAAKWRMTEMV
ncbi:hypothetical protein NL676_038050 [Syzygium grande]|nr:hypothetical protein NL676_038050 [Syzygium grande]